MGRHPATGQGSSPHAWGMSQANGVLLASLVAQRTDGDLVVGRGVPAAWLSGDPPISVTNFPTTDGRRLSLWISSSGRSVSLTLSGQPPSGPVLFQLPSFVDNIATTSAGQVDQGTGTVTLSPDTKSVTVKLLSASGTSGASLGLASGVTVVGLVLLFFGIGRIRRRWLRRNAEE